MIVIIFEVWPHAEYKQPYLEMAADMRTLVEQIDGFISVERFQSLTDPEKLLSVSTFRDEEAVNEWRNTVEHRQAQQAGRSAYFQKYRIRVVSVLRDYSHDNREQVPADSIDYHATN